MPNWPTLTTKPEAAMNRSAISSMKEQNENEDLATCTPQTTGETNKFESWSDTRNSSMEDDNAMCERKTLATELQYHQYLIVYM